MQHKCNTETLVESVAKQAGVSVEDAAKVLTMLGLDGLAANIKDSGGDIGKVGVGELKLAARIGRNTLSV